MMLFDFFFQPNRPWNRDKGRPNISQGGEDPFEFLIVTKMINSNHREAAAAGRWRSGSAMFGWSDPRGTEETTNFVFNVSKIS